MQLKMTLGFNKAILLIVGQIALSVMADYGDTYYDFYSKLGTEKFLPAKSCAEIYHINKASRGRSGYYWIKSTDVYQVYCDMELECGDQKGGWMRIYSFDTSLGHPCPIGWHKHHSYKLCSGNNLAYCYPAYFPSYNVTYKRACGMVKAYQKGTTNAFYPTAFFLGKDDSIIPDIPTTASIDGVYVDGISITFGSPRKHVWTYAAGYSDNGDYPYYNCPCAKYPGPLPPTFVQEHYYCESGNTEHAGSGTFYKYDALWDGESCSERNSCCSQPGMPWFFRIFPKRVEGDFEVRICTDQKYADEAILVEAMEIYVQ